MGVQQSSYSLHESTAQEADGRARAAQVTPEWERLTAHIEADPDSKRLLGCEWPPAWLALSAVPWRVCAPLHSAPCLLHACGRCQAAVIYSEWCVDVFGPVTCCCPVLQVGARDVCL